MNTIRAFFAIFFLVVGGIFLTMLIGSQVGNNLLLGNYIFSIFSFMAYGLPVFYFWLFTILYREAYTAQDFLWPVISILPFLIFSIAIKMYVWDGVSDIAPVYLELKSLLGKTGSVFFLTITGVMIVFGEIMLYILIKQKEPIKQKTTQEEVLASPNISPNVYYKHQAPEHTPDSPPSYTEVSKNINPDLPQRTPPLHEPNQPMPTHSVASPHIDNSNNSEKKLLDPHVNTYILFFNKKKRNISQKVTTVENLDETTTTSVYQDYNDQNINTLHTQDVSHPNPNIANKEQDSGDNMYPYQDVETQEPNLTYTKQNISDPVDATKLEKDNTYPPPTSNTLYTDNNDSTSTSFASTPLSLPPINKITSHNVNINDSQAALYKNRKKKPYDIPILGILDTHQSHKEIDEDINNDVAKILEETLQEFKIEAKVIGIYQGPVVTMFEILPAPGVKLRRIVDLSDNIALRLAAPTVRIVAPIPGKEAVGIEVPNYEREIVSFAELISDKNFYKKDISLPIALGKNISDNIQIMDLYKSPHLLIAGATGSGKSVCINSIICSLLYKCSPEEVKFILIDPKIVELSFYNGIPHLLTPVISDPDKSMQALKWCVEEMEKRYQILEELNVREIRSYNQKITEKSYSQYPHLPFIVLIIDEFADLMMTCGKEIEMLVTRLTAKSRAIGIHLVIATQRPSTDVITGLIKSNIPTRISFMVTSKVDSRIILDKNGAETLLGKGDMLFSSSSDPFPERLQGPYLSEREVEQVVTHVKQVGGEPHYISDEIFAVSENKTGDNIDAINDDPLWHEAVEEVINVKKASASHLQRRFKIGYNRAARLVEEMEEKGIIGPQQGSKPREVYTEAVV